MLPLLAGAEVLLKHRRISIGNEAQSLPLAMEGAGLLYLVKGMSILTQEEGGIKQ